MLGYHVRLRPKNSDHLGTTRQERCMVARSVLDRGRDFGLTSFGLGGQHLHMYPFCDRPSAGELSRRVSLSLIRPLGLEAGFEEPYIEPIKNMRHAYNTFTYLLEQETHHRIPQDRRGEGSNLQDLLGLRLFGTYTAVNVRRYLPNIDRARLLGILGVPDLVLSNAPLDALVDAGLAAAGLHSIKGGGRELAWLRRALIDVCDGRLVDRVLAEELQISLRTLQRLRHTQVDPLLVRAIRLQLGSRFSRR